MLYVSSATSDQSARTPQEVAQIALGSMSDLLRITDANGQSSFGSGFVVGTGQIATNRHVIKGIASGIS